MQYKLGVMETKINVYVFAHILNTLHISWCIFDLNQNIKVSVIQQKSGSKRYMTWNII